MTRSCKKLEMINDLMCCSIPVYEGSRSYLKGCEGVRSAAVEDLICAAHRGSSTNPLYVLGMACATNLASAILIDPTIRNKVVMVWTAGYPTSVNLKNTSFNLEQDVKAAQVLFTSGVPLVYLPGFYIGQQLSMSKADVVEWFKDSGKVGKRLFQRYMTNPLFKWYGVNPCNLTGRIWTIWDLIVPAWLLNKGGVSTQEVTAPCINDELFWVPNPDGAKMLEGTYTNYNNIVPDFVDELKKFAKEDECDRPCENGKE